ncbi:MAG TPA: hypothetical protein VE127_13345, partial [Solirubrobacteraceae bacterium]|nr:hypothetical protein [Solirubrobacteraceae bacterium]
PARPLIVRSAKAAATAASTLRTVSLGPATSDGLRATTGPMTALSDDVGSVARHVTDTSSSKIAQDVSRLQQALAVLPTSTAG